VSFASSDLGELRSLATALGILDGDGDFNEDWLSAPGDHLSSVLAKQVQRDALVEFVDEVLGGETREEDPDGLIWLPIVSHDAPRVTFYVVLDESPANYVAIGIGARLTTAPTVSRTSVHVPLFRAAKQGKSVPDAILIGTAAAVVRLTTDITVGSGPPLRGIGLSLRVPTAGSAAPEFSLALTGLQLPGADAPRDLEISAASLDTLDDAALDLVLGLLRAQADALGAGAAASLVGLLGLSAGGAVPRLPLDRLVAEGPAVLATWLASVISSGPARAAWLGHLATLIGGAVTGDEVSLTVGTARVALGVRGAPGTGGHLRVTPTIAVSVDAGPSVRVRADAELLTLDTGDARATALPRLAVFAHVGRRPDGGANVLTGDPAVQAVRIGLTLNDARRPTFLLAADGVTIGSRFHETLDLSTPDAIAEVGGTLLSDVIADLLGQLGAVGEALRLFLGLTAPPSDPGVTLVELPAFLGDPLGAVRGYWRALLRDHAAAVPDILTSLRDLLADDSRAATAVAGAGTEEDPWRVPIVGPITLDARRLAGGDALEVAVGAAYVTDELGNRCTVVETRLAVGLARLDLAGVQATLLSSVEAQLVTRQRGATRAAATVGPLTLVADHIGLRARWRPASGLGVDVVAPNLGVELGETRLPVTLPALGGDGAVALDAAGWDAVEALAGVLASVTPVPWLADLVAALGWVRPATGAGQPRLRLADLMTGDPAAAVRGWLTGLVLDDAGQIADGLAALARILTGSAVASGRFRGLGTDADPWRLPILPVDRAPELCVWLLPDGPAPLPRSIVPERIRAWRPGDPGLDPADLADAVHADARLAVDLRDLASDRPALGEGLALLAERWVGTDGLIVPPAPDPPGVTVHRFDGATITDLPALVDPAALLGAAPGTIVHVAVVAAGAALPWPDAPADRVIDVRAPGLAPESFAPPAAQAGAWFVALAPRADARLAAGDTDGTLGQRDRLRRVLAPFGSVAGPRVLVARGGAGHAALAAANELPFVDAVVTLGTPFTAVAFTIVQDRLAGDALRLLRWILPPTDPAEPDDPDLARGRSLVDAMLGRITEVDPGADLRPPGAPLAPRAGLPVHACFGVVSTLEVLRALTAVVAAGLSLRAMARDAVDRAHVTGVRAGLRVPLAVAAPDLSVSGWARLELVGADAHAEGPALSVSRALDVHLEIRRPDGWLSGGPSGIDPPPTAELRWLSANVRLPLGGAGEASAEIVLHEPTVFGIARERWIVRPAGAASAAAEVVTPALPEVRVLMSLAAERLAAAVPASPDLTAVVQALGGLGLLSPSGGTVPDGIDHLLHDTAAHVGAALGAAASRAAIASGLNALLAGVTGATADLAARRLTLDAAGAPGARGLLAWTAHLEATAAGQASALVTLGAAGVSPAGGAVLRIDATAASPPLRVDLEWHRAGGAPEVLPLWPAPDGPALARAAARLVPAECARVGLEFLRGLDATARALLDAALDALGLLSAPDAAGQRRVRLPAALLADPVAWLGHAGALGGPDGLNPTRAIALLDALKPLIGIGGGPGEWTLGPGARITATSAAGGVTLALGVDTAGFTPIASAPGRVVAAGSFGLTLRPGAAPAPAVEVAVGLPASSPGRRAVHVALDGGLRVFLRPDSGPDLSLYPDPPGLGQLAQAAVTQALPLALDALAAETGADLAGTAGRVVRAVGDALDLRTGTPRRFDGARLQAWAADPAHALSAAIPTLTGAALTEIAAAIQPLLPAGSAASAAGGALSVTVNALTLTWRPAPLEITLEGEVTGLTGIERVEIAVGLTGAGLAELTAAAGPAALDVGGVTLRPYAAVSVGQAPPGGRRIEIGLATDAPGAKRFGARWSLDPTVLSLVAIDGASVSTSPADVALALLDAVLDLVAVFAIRTDAVQDLLDRSVGATTVRNVLRRVVLEDAPDPTALDADLFDPARLLTRLQRLAANLADANPTIAVGGNLSIGLDKSGPIVQLILGVNGRAPLAQNGVVVAIEADSRWIKDAPPAGLAIDVLDVGGSAFAFAPGLAVNGIGLRISKSSGPLLDVGVTLGSIACHLFGKVEASGALSGGVQVQLSDLAVGVAGAQGGNPIAQGLMKDAGSGQNKLAPAFSPALAVQKHGSGPVLVSLRAGDGSGPWWLAIQRGFGPIYIEQVGFGVTVEQDQLEKISLLLDGRVSLFGLTAAVDDLQLTFVVASDASVFDPSRWAVDLAGLAINADLAGVMLAGGLRKFGEGDSVEYVGMLLARFGPYGLSVFGGYGSAVVDGERFAAFFAFGAVNGPIGGPPAFFLTGIGGGIGINRGLTFPDDLSRFDQFPFIKALDPSAQPSEDPLAELGLLRVYFPMRRGEFWFAAGISFTSFALVDGIAVVAVAVGDGLEIALLGLARLALPRPQFPLVSIELGLIARFSTKEGVFWVQAQLTDNSWILHESVRLTGGFAFVTWFAGPNKGQFVLSIGGFHPDFHRDGYPQVPRLGFRWGVSDAIVVKGESYFALTSEAVMAGGELSASAELGPAWAHVAFGANGIVYFDPFRFDVEVYARISAGVTIDVWIGEITISISLGASIRVMGPKIHGVATFEVGPVELTVEFGDSSQSGDNHISWDAFVRKYLEEAAPGVARVLTAVPGKGALPPGTGPGGATDTGTADGSDAKPFEVFAEFEIMVTTTVPTETVRAGGVDDHRTPSQALGIAPMNIDDAASTLVLALRNAAAEDWIGALVRDVQAPGAFPLGVWGLPQAVEDPKVPRGDIVEAIDSVRFEAVAAIRGTLPGEIAYNRIDPPGPRKPLPFVHAHASRALFVTAAQSVSALLPDVHGAPTFELARPWLAAGGHGRTALAAIARERSAPPRLGTLTQGLVDAELPPVALRLPPVATRPPVDTRVLPPRAIALLASPVLRERPIARTTVTDRRAPRVAPPTLESVRAEMPLAVAATLMRQPAPAARDRETVVASVNVPYTRAARGGTAAVAVRGGDRDAQARLRAISALLGGARAAAPGADSLRAGDIAILQMPNAARDRGPESGRPRLAITGGQARLVALAHGGRVLLDGPGAPGGTAIPRGTERIAVISLGTAVASPQGLHGWHGGQELPSLGWGSALGPGVVVQAEGGHVRQRPQRFRAGWVRGAELVATGAIVNTRFSAPVTAVALIVDDPVGGPDAKELSLVLDGADRPAGRDGQPESPIVVTLGNRSALVYATVPSAARRDRLPVVISVARQPGLELVGVLGGTETAEALARRLAANGLDAALQPLVPTIGGAVQIAWARGAEPPSRPSGAPTRAPAPTRPTREPSAPTRRARRRRP
jgi:hypothetical protein